MAINLIINLKKQKYYWYKKIYRYFDRTKKYSRMVYKK